MELKKLRSSGEWREYFTNNRQGLALLTWDAEVRISHHEREAVIQSLQAFQLGESSEGLHLYHCADQYSNAAGDFDYVEAIKLFIREEQRHAQYLARFMEFVHIPFARRMFIDTVFRRLRQLAGLECSIGILIVAEIIAKVFYRALRNATKCDFLEAICDQILRDEKMHVQFQAERLAILRKKKNRAILFGTNIFHRVLFAGTVLVVWMKCRKALRAGGYLFASFFRDCWEELNLAATLMDPRLYEQIPSTPAVSGVLANSTEP